MVQGHERIVVGIDLGGFKVRADDRASAPGTAPGPGLQSFGFRRSQAIRPLPPRTAAPTRGHHEPPDTGNSSSLLEGFGRQPSRRRRDEVKIQVRSHRQILPSGSARSKARRCRNQPSSSRCGARPAPSQTSHWIIRIPFSSLTIVAPRQFQQTGCSKSSISSVGSNLALGLGARG